MPTKDYGVFWGEISPCDHCVQIYEDDAGFLDALEGFAAGGLRRGDAAVIIATPAHRASLRARLTAQGLDVAAAEAENRYIALDAAGTLAMFMRAGWPDDALFAGCVQSILRRARGRSGRHVRAFGEMVALMWAQGHSGATVRLEHLWHQLCQREAFALFCAYPKVGFTRDATDSLRDICAAHDKVIESVH